MKYLDKLKYIIPLLLCSLFVLTNTDKVRAWDNGGYDAIWDLEQNNASGFLGPSDVQTTLSLSCSSGSPNNTYIGPKTNCSYSISLSEYTKKLMEGLAQKYESTSCPSDNPYCKLGHALGDTYYQTAAATFNFSNSAKITVKYNFHYDSNPPLMVSIGENRFGTFDNFNDSTSLTNIGTATVPLWLRRQSKNLGSVCNNGSDTYYEFSCSDGESGCKAASSYGLVMGAGDTSVQSINFEDNAGNQARVFLTRSFDTTGPSNYGAIIPSGWANSKSPTPFCNESGCSCTVSKTTFTSNGSVTVTCMDKCGNKSKKSFPVDKIETVAPKCGDQTFPDQDIYHKGKFKATVRCKEDKSNTASGCASKEFSQVVQSASGNVTIRDKAGNTKSCPYTATVDNTKPTIEFEIDEKYGTKNTIKTNDEEVMVTVKAADSGSKPKYICYEIESDVKGMSTDGVVCRKIGSSTIASSSTGVTIRTSFTFSAEGEYTLSVYALDHARTMDTNKGTYPNKNYNDGNKSGVITKVISIDRTPPVCGVKYPPEWAQSKKVTGTCKDDSGECKSIKLSKENFTQVENVTVTCRDQHGNISKKTELVKKIDSVPPVCGEQTSPTDEYYLKDSFWATLGCNEDTDGIRVSGCTKKKFTETKKDKTGTVTIRDVAGNTAKCPYTALLDTKAPTVSYEISSSYDNMSETLRTSNDKVDVTIKAVDKESTPRYICYKVVHEKQTASSIGYTCLQTDGDEGVIQSASKQTARLTVPVGELNSAGKVKEGKYIIYAYAIDNTRTMNLELGTIRHHMSYGNKSEPVTKDIYIDVTAPKATFDYVSSDKWKNTSTPITISVADKESGIGSFQWFWSKSQNTFDNAKVLGEKYESTYSQYSTDGKRTRTLTHPTSADYNGVLYLHVRVCDRAFPNPNCADYKSDKGIKFDNIAPEIEYVTPSSTKTTSGQKDDDAPWSNNISITVRGIDTVFLTGDRYTPLKYSELTEEQKGKVDSEMSSGLNNIYLHWDTNEYHKDTDLTLNTSTFSDSASIYNKYLNVNFKGYYNWKLNFSGYQSREEDGTYTTMEKAVEGVRYIKVRVTDNANNSSEFYKAGPFKYDVTNPIVKDEGFEGQSGYFISAEEQLEEYENMN